MKDTLLLWTRNTKLPESSKGLNLHYVLALYDSYDNDNEKKS